MMTDIRIMCSFMRIALRTHREEKGRVISTEWGPSGLQILSIYRLSVVVFHDIILSFTLISFSLVAKLHFDGEQKDGTESKRTLKNSKLLLKRLGQDFIFLCQIFLGFPFRRKLRGISFEPCLLSHSRPSPAISCSPSLFVPYNVRFLSFYSFCPQLSYHRIPSFVFRTELLPRALSCFCCLVP